MTDDNVRAILVQRLKENLPSIRKIVGWSGAGFGKLLDLSRQSVSKLETGTSDLSVAQFIAIRHILDAWVAAHPEYKTLPRIFHLLLDERRIWGHCYKELREIAKSIAAAKMSGVDIETIDKTAKMQLDEWEKNAWKYCLEHLKEDCIAGLVGVGPEDIPADWTEVIMRGVV